MGSSSDEEYCIKIAKHCKELGLICQLRVTSAHKGTEGTLQALAEYEGMWVIFYDTICLSVCALSPSVMP
jgi:phosphoribosylcarboxyaminoimidazole (NCAIR) mutase